MYQRLAKVDLSAGRRVEAGVVRAPDPDWAGHVMELWNGFDIGPWKEVLERLLTDDIGTEVRIYLLHRDGIPLSGMMTVEDRGVGLRGNVWTRPGDRRQGACAGLMEVQMRDFSNRGGFRAMPTPDGVPVATTSPGSSVKAVERCSTRAKQSKMSCLVFDSWRSSPFTQVRRSTWWGSGSSSAVTIQGPMGP